MLSLFRNASSKVSIILRNFQKNLPLIFIEINVTRHSIVVFPLIFIIPYLQASLSLSRCQSTLVLVEHNGKNVLPATKHAITAAKKVGGEISCLVAGPEVGSVAKEVAAIQGLSKVLVVENKDYNGFMPERLTPLLLAAQDQFKFSHIVAGASAFSRGLLPRVAAKVYSDLHLI